MLQRRLSGRLLAGLALVTLVACADEPIEDNLVRPGITAIGETRDLACGADGAAIRTAIEAYALLHDERPVDEAALVDGGFLRGPSDAWDVTDGELVAQDPACGSVGETGAPPTMVDIVTDSEPASPDELLEAMTDRQIAEVGGAECARELVELFAAAERFVAELDREPTDIDDLVTEGFLDAPPDGWAADGDDLHPVEGSGCIDIG